MVTVTDLSRTFIRPPRSVTVANVKYSSGIMCVVGYVAEDELIEVTPSKIRFVSRLMLDG